MTLIAWDEDTDGSLSDSAMTRKLERLGCRVTRYVYPPGTFFAPHTHSIDKIDAVVSGEFKIGLPTGEVILGPGDALRIPAGLEHSARVVGRMPVVSLDGVCMDIERAK